MIKIKAIISLIFLFATIPTISNAEPVIWDGNGTYEIGSGKDWFQIPELQTYDNVIVKMYEGGVHQFSMFDNSNLTTYGPGGIDYLNLYDNATASLLGGYFSGQLYIDPANTGWLKLYAYNVTYLPSNPYGEGNVMGNWLNVPYGTFNINLRGNGAYSHVQIVPEPASAVIFAVGAGWIISKRKRQ